MARYTFLYKVQGIGVHGGLPWGLQPCMNDYLGFRFHTAAWILQGQWVPLQAQEVQLLLEDPGVTAVEDQEEVEGVRAEPGSVP